MILTRDEIEKIIAAVRNLVRAADGNTELLVRDACIAHFAEKVLLADAVAKLMRNRSYVNFIWSEACRA